MACITRRPIPVIVSKCVEKATRVLRIAPTTIAKHRVVIQIAREVKPCK